MEFAMRFTGRLGHGFAPISQAAFRYKRRLYGRWVRLNWRPSFGFISVLLPLFFSDEFGRHRTMQRSLDRTANLE
jgi:hypothetical protein